VALRDIRLGCGAEIASWIGSVAIGLRSAGLPPRIVLGRAHAGRSPSRLRINKLRPYRFGRTLTARSIFLTRLGFVIAAPMRVPSVLVMMSVMPEDLRGM
jgi:hypothetical protein